MKRTVNHSALGFAALKVLVLNGSLKHKGKLSNTEELAKLVIKNMKMLNHDLVSEIIRLSDYEIPPGVKFKENRNDKWPEIARKIVDSDIVIFATPIWWGHRSSLMQRVIERMDSFDEAFIKEGRSVLLNTVAGVVITGSEDGAQETLGSILSVLTFMNFTIPPQSCTYWVGEVGNDPKGDRQKRLKNKACQKMAKYMASNLVNMAKLLKNYPLKQAEV